MDCFTKRQKKEVIVFGQQLDNETTVFFIYKLLTYVMDCYPRKLLHVLSWSTSDEFQTCTTLRTVLTLRTTT